MVEGFPISGNIDPAGFPFLLIDLHRQGATGSLRVEGPSYQKALYFRGGRILFGSSNDPRDQLGAILIESGKITPEQLEDVNAKVGPGNPLAKVLTETGFVSPRELSEAARAKVERILSDILTYTSGGFEFEDGVLPKGAVDLKLSTERVFLAAVRRISDRNFVLLHLKSLEIVLASSPDLGTRLAEIQSETHGLVPYLDGRNTLKQATSRAALEEFEAAKIACGLLFLGLIRPSGAHASAETPLVMVDEEDAELDLAQTARQALGSESAPHIPPPEPAPPMAAESEPPPFFMHEAEPPDESVPPAAAKAPPPPLELDMEPAEEPVPEPEPTTQMPVPPPPAPTVMMQRKDALPLIPPPSGPLRPPAATRPTKADLVALDAILNTSPNEGPLQPFEKKPGTERWTPQFQPPDPRFQRGGHARSTLLRSIVLGGAAILILGGIGAGAWYYMQSDAGKKLMARIPTGTRTPMPTPVPARSPIVATASPASPPSLNPPTVSPTASARPAPTPAPTAARAPATSESAAPAARETGAGQTPAQARALLQSGRFSEAAREFLSRARSAPPGTLSIQLLVACAPETVQKATQSVDAKELFILPVNLKGRSCYRLCWGLYENPADAAGAVRALPPYFRTGGSSPRVVPASELVP